MRSIIYTFILNDKKYINYFKGSLTTANFFFKSYIPIALQKKIFYIDADINRALNNETT